MTASSIEAQTEYVVRLRGAPPAASGAVTHRHRGRRRLRRRLVIVLALAVVAFVQRSTITGWFERAGDGARGSVHALQAEQQIQNAGNVLERQWSRDGAYDVSTDRLAELGGGVDWGEVVKYEVCFAGMGAVASATTVAGARSVLVIRGFDYGIIAGEPGCPESATEPAPWTGP